MENKEPTIDASVSLGILAALGGGYGSYWGCNPVCDPPPNKGVYKSGHHKYREHTRSDEIAFQKRVAKRRAKKGYR
jgi:hypothetical protein